VELVKEGLTEAGVDLRQAEGVFSPAAKLIVTEAGVKLGTMGNVICASYNKPQAVEYFLQSRKLNAKTVVFVDDNSDNVYSMFVHFASKETQEGLKAPAVWSCWYPPPPGGREEVFDETSQTIVKRLAALKP